MDTRFVLRVLALVIGIYGLWLATLLPGLAVAPASALLACVAVETVAAFATAIGLWLGSAWAPIATIVLGAAIAVTQIVEGPVLGLIAVDRAILVGAIAVVLAIVIAAVARRPARRSIGF